jgi:hypothetical protein
MFRCHSKANTGLNPVDYLGFHLLDPTVPLP